ncbi:MAG: SDR family NAD(P)-dependent oxidoreductase [Oculatellaceae cyanobacterium Prado106]|jgi:NAD(P)-dependent dehydrogenase (short-subunit alcohol dehydrogenase family)|nr:SDR family NAD(P)-dependent oxidoreductase [Oculatellaceae cyanobacterium Prado106]
MPTPSPSTVFVVSGGARGVTAQCVIRLAQLSQCKLILLGRSPLTEGEPDWAIGCTDEVELKRRIMEHLKAQGEKPTPMGIQKLLKAVTSQREIRATLAAIQAAGSPVKYLNVDVTQVEALQQQLEQAAQEFGSITGIVHGAGNLADKWIEKKTEQDFETVYEAKVQGLENLLQCIPLAQLQYLVLFSSVAGFYGNPGQSDYALANEILNKSAHRVKQLHPNCHVVSINWGPWDSGMVTPELKRTFADRNIRVIPLEVGAQMMVDELGDRFHSEAQVVIGSPITPGSVIAVLQLQTYRIHRRLTAVANPFLRDYQWDGAAVLPPTIAASWLIQACEQLYPGYEFDQIEGFRVIQQLRLDAEFQDDFILDIREIAKQPEGIEFEVLAWGGTSTPAAEAYYQAQVRLRPSLGKPETDILLPIHFPASEAPVPALMSGSTLYQDGTLWQGKCFQGIEQVIELSESRALFRCRVPRVGNRDQGQFPIQTFDPYAADSLAQALMLWSKAFYHTCSLPLGWTKLIQQQPLPKRQSYWVAIEVVQQSETSVTATVTAQSDQGEVYLQCIEMQMDVYHPISSHRSIPA